jgi:hypothetical protein
MNFIQKIALQVAEELREEKNPLQKLAKGVEKRGTEGDFSEYCGGKVTQACVDRAAKEGGKRAQQASLAVTFSKAKGGGPSLTYPKQEVDEASIMSRIVELVEEELQKTLSEDDDWIQDVDADIERRGTEGVCTGDKFGSDSCPPGSRRYNLAKTFRRIAKDRKKD